MNVPKFGKSFTLNITTKQTELPSYTRVKDLTCFNNKLRRIPSMPQVVVLEVSTNYLKIIPTMPNLKYLHCNYNYMNILNYTAVSLQLYQYL
jgi:Leucine-rich repeat (LRR) protein